MKPRRTIVVGLGNPGEEFAKTYHNVGALALQTIADGLTFKTHRSLFSFATAGRAAFIFPLTFMNESGLAVREAMKKFGAKPEDLIVIHDESDLPVGKYKISVHRNAAGHKGVQSIMDALHAKEFTRVRIGIRPADEKRREKAEVFVLKNITPKDRRVFENIFSEIARRLAEPRYSDAGGVVEGGAA